ncbi:hypothetical protein [Frankia sp. QA3]|uniref:hypothetical protein n=1 Tax=Frankia sp. QA3 TaxID=710111 RepID=UPI000269B8BE|nr:hypothetical protein [Frankia sp. QA3]EIV90827.1 hypothetical protein FraQA3DRAFT_0233 [Frankia sp. QA3]
MPTTTRPLTPAMHRGLTYLASKGGRIHHLDTTVRANTVTALMARNLVTQTVARGTTLYYVLTAAGWAALAAAYGVQVRPEQDTPDRNAAVLTRDDTAALAIIADGGVMNPAAHGIAQATMDRLCRRGLIHTVCGVSRITPAGDRALGADTSIPVRPSSVRIFFAYDLPPAAAAPWIAPDGAVWCPVGRELAERLLVKAGVGMGWIPAIVSVRDVPMVIRMHVRITLEEKITTPSRHPLRAMAAA